MLDITDSTDSTDAPDSTGSTDSTNLEIHTEDLSLDERLLKTQQRRALCHNLENEILTMAAQINAVTYRFIKLLAEFDENDGWHGDVIQSFSHWLNWKIGMGSLMAREKVRVARALVDLPLIDTAFSKGEVSYSKVRAMTRAATPENEEYLMMIARHGTAAHIEFLVQKYQFKFSSQV